MMLRAMVLFAFAFAASNPAHVAETDAFRKKHEEDYRRQFVPLAGLFSLEDGVHTVGSARSSDIILPKTAPPTVGKLVAAADRIRFEPAPGARVMLKDQPVTSTIDVKRSEERRV